jgi:ATP-binding cassette subfamily B protein
MFAVLMANIDFFRGLPPGEVERSAALAQFDGEIRAFPDGYAQGVGQRGVTLSGGQKQRLTIARALAGRPELLVMDDVTASLDAENEERFWNEVVEVRGTVVAVTHRSPPRRADRVVVLDRGRIEAVGRLTARAISPTFRRHRRLRAWPARPPPRTRPRRIMRA